MCGVKIQTTFLIPIREDKDVGNGELHPGMRWEMLHEDLFLNFKGYTLAPGLYSGSYLDPDIGEKVADLSRKYYIAIETENLDKLRKYLKEIVGPMFRQKSIYFEAKGEVEFIESNFDKLEIYP